MRKSAIALILLGACLPLMAQIPGALGKRAVAAGTMTGNNGTSYQTVQIGTQLWMAEYLRETQYANGDPIPEVSSSATWIGLSTGARCSNTYGYMYNWYAVDDSRDIAPSGWHVPSMGDYAILAAYLGGTSVAGGKMKESGTSHWSSPNTGATNESGFTALPGGWRSNSNGNYLGVGANCYQWSSSENDASTAGAVDMSYTSAGLALVYTHAKRNGFLVRLVSDASLSVSLTSFSAHQEGSAVLLNWVTESECDNAGYILERRSEGAQWQTIASYETHAGLMGQGNTSERTEYVFVDEAVACGAAYDYRLSDVSRDGVVMVQDVIGITLDLLPAQTMLKPAYPNPFNPSTKIQYELAEEANVTLGVVDVLGRHVQTIVPGETKGAGVYSIHWNGCTEDGLSAPSGVYFLVMRAGDAVETQKVMLVR